MSSPVFFSLNKSFFFGVYFLIFFHDSDDSSRAEANRIRFEWETKGNLGVSSLFRVASDAINSSVKHVQRNDRVIESIEAIASSEPSKIHFPVSFRSLKGA